MGSESFDVRAGIVHGFNSVSKPCDELYPHNVYAVKGYIMGQSKNVDWITLRAEWEAGTPVGKLSMAHGISRSRIHQVKNKQGWIPKTTPLKDSVVAASVDNVDPKDKKPVKTIPKGRSIGQPIGEEGRDREMLSQFQALVDGSPPDAKAVLHQAATEIELMKQHRTTISRASVIADHILTRLYALLVDGQASDVITFKTKTGEAYHRVAFLGDRESVSDALLKCANVISKLVPLERQAHGLKDNTAEKLPTIIFKTPLVKIISVDGKGQIIRKGALIEQGAEQAGSNGATRSQT